MAFLRMAFFPGGTIEHWRVVAAAVGDVTIPGGRRAFASGPAAGGWQVMQLWDSRDALDRFNREVYFPAVARLGDRGFPEPPVVTDVETVDAWIDETVLP